MAGDWVAVAAAVTAYLAFRLIDYLLPKGRHFKAVAKFSHPDHDDDAEPEADE